MKKKKIIKIVLIVLVVLMTMVGIFGYYIWNFTSGSEKISGVQDSIPAVQKEIPPIKKGEHDWRYWHGAAFDKKSTQTGIRKDWSGGLEKLWEVTFLCQGRQTVSWAAPVVQGNRLVVPGRDEESDLVFCLNPDDGTLIWQEKYPAETQTNHGPGARATPFIDDDRVYTFGRSGDLVCWQLYDGKMLWKKSVMDEGGEEPQWGHSSSPLVYGDNVYVQGGGKALAIAYNKMNGDVVWKSMEGIPGYAPLTIYGSGDNQQLLLFHGTGLSALKPDNGQELWTEEWITDYNVNASLPLSEGNIIFATSGYGKGCMAVKVEGEKAEKLWESTVIEGQHTDPVIIDGYVYGYSGNSSQNKGDLKCIRLQDGKEMWSTTETGYGTLIYADGHLICFDIKGNLYLVEVNHEKFVKKSEMKKAFPGVKKPSWTMPVIANGKLYLRYMQTLICYKI